MFSPRGVILNHREIEKDPALGESYLQTQNQVIGHFDDVSRKIEEECIMASQRIWNNLPHSLKNREYHTPERLRGALEREPLYKRALQAKKIQWLALNLNPPLMLRLTNEEDTDAQDKEWENEEKNDGFYPLGETPTLLPQETRGLSKL